MLLRGIRAVSTDHPRKPWWHPSTLQGAWRDGKRTGDAELRGLTTSLLRFGVQAGVGAMLALVMLLVLDRQLQRQERAAEVVATALRESAARHEAAVAVLGDRLAANQDEFQNAVISALVGGRPAPARPVPAPKPVRASR